METLLTLAKPLLFIVIVLLLYFFCIKPLMGMMEQASPSSQQKSPPAGHHAEDDTDLHLPPKRMSDQERLHRLAQSDPDRAKELIRQWLRDENK